jgi:hypothetical protein
MNKTSLTILGVAFSMGAAWPSAQAAPPVDLILNGDFETGNFAGWSVVNTGSGSWVINNGTFVPPGPGGALPPISGNFDAVSQQGGPGFHALRQTITVPGGVFAASLTWNDRVRNFAGIFSSPNQEWRVVIRDTAGNLLQEVFSTMPGDPSIQIGPNSRFGDLTGFFKSNANQTVVVSFEEQDNLFFFNATLDDVRLLVSTLPTSKNECKDQGWSTFVNVITGQKIFKNQGDCVSFVATKGKNPPANY